MRFRILGPLLVATADGWLPVAAKQQRVVLATLLVEAGQTVSVDQLVDAVWGERPPRSAVNTVQAYVLRLRRLLGDDGGRLATRGRRYQLMVDEDDVDATVFERMVGSGRRELASGQPTAAAERLADALALWRGPVLADVPDSLPLTARATQLERLRLDAEEERVGALLDLDRHADVIGELRQMAEHSPLRERRWEQLMLALHRAGRRAEALQVYQRARRVLADELGLEPGTELRRLQLAVLADDSAPDRPPPAAGRPSPAAVAARAYPESALAPRPGGAAARGTASRPGGVVPAQLPADVAGFTGRHAYLARLDGLLAACDDRALPLAIVAGAAGAGKTALAVHWAHHVRDRFPAGQLYVNLRGYAAGPPVRPIEALAAFLTALGVPAKEIPAVPADAAALYRSLLAGRPMLVLLDNARTPGQVRPLLPGGAGSIVVVTSRDRLTGLVASDGANRIDLPPLTPDEAQALLERLLGAQRAHADREATASLARLCDHLPLALRIAAANLVGRPSRQVAAYAAELAASDRLTALEVEGDPQSAVRVAFDHSYRGLPDRERRLFRLLGLVPSPDVTAAAAAALAGSPAAEAGQLLGALAAAHLVDEPAPGRYALHDLLRHYAAERAAAEERPADLDEAWQRLGTYLLRMAEAAAVWQIPTWRGLPGSAGLRTGTEFGNQPQALAWLDAERLNLVATVRHAAEHGPYPVAWRLGHALWRYLQLRMSLVDWLAVGEASLAAAGRGGDLPAQAWAHFSVGIVHTLQSRHRQAVEHLGSALAVATQAGWLEGETMARSGLGHVCMEQGQFREAVDHYGHALALARRTEDVYMEQSNVMNLGVAYYGLGLFPEAVDHYRQALALARHGGAQVAEGRILGNLGDAYRALGRLDDALAVLERAATIQREMEDRFAAGDTSRALAAVHREAGRLAEALALATSALAQADRTGDHRLRAACLVELAAVRDRLGEHRLAAEGYEKALALAHQTGNRYAQAQALVGLAVNARHDGRPEQAARAAGDALRLARQGGYRELVTAAGALLPP